MRRLVAGVVVGLAAVVLAPADARESASRVIDRTFSCETGYVGGVYQASVESYWSVPPQVDRRTASATVVTNLANGFLAGVSSRSMYVNRLYCKEASAKVMLTTRGMRGGEVSPFSTEYDCFTSRRVLLRIRGDFAKPTTLRTASPTGFPMLRAEGATKRTELALATLAGKPIAYATTVGTKTARLFTSTNCQED